MRCKANKSSSKPHPASILSLPVMQALARLLGEGMHVEDFKLWQPLHPLFAHLPIPDDIDGEALFHTLKGADTMTWMQCFPGWSALDVIKLSHEVRRKSGKRRKRGKRSVNSGTVSSESSKILFGISGFSLFGRQRVKPQAPTKYEKGVIFAFKFPSFPDVQPQYTYLLETLGNFADRLGWRLLSQNYLRTGRGSHQLFLFYPYLEYYAIIFDGEHTNTQYSILNNQ
jgi:hypothetical protein